MRFLDKIEAASNAARQNGLEVVSMPNEHLAKLINVCRCVEEMRDNGWLFSSRTLDALDALK